jgi:tripartite-type tricarboxylate transporter receptor subunit TctC
VRNASPTDVPARVLAAMMQERIGHNIVIDNKPGGSGVVGGAFAARAAPDGYTLFANSARKDWVYLVSRSCSR